MRFSSWNRAFRDALLVSAVLLPAADAEKSAPKAAEPVEAAHCITEPVVLRPDARWVFASARDCGDLLVTAETGLPDGSALRARFFLSSAAGGLEARFEGDRLLAIEQPLGAIWSFEPSTSDIVPAPAQGYAIRSLQSGDAVLPGASVTIEPIDNLSASSNEILNLELDPGERLSIGRFAVVGIDGSLAIEGSDGVASIAQVARERAALLEPGALREAQERAIRDCVASSQPGFFGQVPGRGNPVSIRRDRSPYSGSYDGRGGVDTLRFDGPATMVLGGDRFRSLEIVNVANGTFDVIAPLARYFSKLEYGELEIVADFFDVVILDPALEWTATLEPGERQRLTASDWGGDYTIILPLDVTVWHGPVESVVTTADWPSRVGHPGAPATVAPHAGVSAFADAWDAPAPDETADRPATVIRLSGDAAGERVRRFDLRNAKTDLLEIDLLDLLDEGDVRLDVMADAEDRVALAQPGCWQIGGRDAPEGDADGRVWLAGGSDLGPRITLTAPAAMLPEPSWQLEPPSPDRRPVWVRSKGDAFYHLGTDIRVRADAIDLADGWQNTLVVRADGRLIAGRPVRVRGDIGDRVWLDGSAGWRLEVVGGAARALVPAPDGHYRILQFEAGVEVGLLPAPGFLWDARMTALASYPGAADAKLRGSKVTLSRGGSVAFSATQMEGVEAIDLTNGLPNRLVLDPARLAMAAGVITVRGDPGLDIVEARGFRCATSDCARNGDVLTLRPEAPLGEPREIDIVLLPLLR